ncbi:MAG: hypothetical protein ACI4PT_11070, partial [Candidatus Avoscillospira sp.]
SSVSLEADSFPSRGSLGAPAPVRQLPICLYQESFSMPRALLFFLVSTRLQTTWICDTVIWTSSAQVDFL